ncbi:6206_t:CDS:2 [Ambispora gerdemannii]|uniref:6206_t:CDS:1 n=1 Tax=Ambispora gerdemannii TaxID=144530 RepID=A0A9N8YJI6_9GLOM|nr:6206_t:CDS:2 [Ambispora gerdemannii]
MHTSTIFDQTDRTGTARYDGADPDEYLSDSSSCTDNRSDLGSDDYNDYESNYESDNEEAPCASTSNQDSIGSTTKWSSLYNAYDRDEVEDKLVIKIDQDGDRSPTFSVADDISEVYGLPGIHECINGQNPLRAVIDIDALQEDMEANGVKAQEVFIRICLSFIRALYRILDCSWEDILRGLKSQYRLTNLQIQYIIDRVNLTVTNKTVNNVYDQSHVTSEMITSDTTAPITLLSMGHITSEKIVNASQTTPAEVPAFSQPNASPEMISSDMFQASVSSASQSKPAYDHSYFRNKILDQYPNIYRECSSENFDYYGITDEMSCGDYICPLCKLGHDDEEIEGRYKAGSYFIKCEQREIEIVA